MQIDRRYYQIIFDSISKGAVIFRKDKTTHLDDPFTTFAEAEDAAFEYLGVHNGLPDESPAIAKKSRVMDRD